MKTLALFDFDGTLYKKDSLLEFIKFYKGNTKFYFGILILLPVLVGLKLGMLKNEKVKIKFISYFFKNNSYSDFVLNAEKFALSQIDKNLNPEIEPKFKNHVAQNNQVYIVTASFPEWIEPWGKQFGVKVIGTNLEIIQNRITGKFESKNCFGIEKVNRIKSIVNLENFEKIDVYGSGTGDFEMLKLRK